MCRKLHKYMIKKRKKSFPTAFTILFIILVLSAILTKIVPAGKFSKLTFDSNTQQFIIKSPDDKIMREKASEEFLKKLNINLKLDKFIRGEIKKPISIPNTYKEIESHPQGIIEILKAPIQGITDSVDVMIFILILGGIIGIVNKMGALDAGMVELSKRTKGREFLLITLVFVLTTIGGTTFGFSEETIPFYPILIPIFLISGFDVMTCIATIYTGSAIGCMFSTVNPFSVVIASNAAGINFTSGLVFRIIALVLASVITLIYIYKYAKKVKDNPEKSLTYLENRAIHHKFLGSYDKNVNTEFTRRRKLVLLVFMSAFVIMIYGVAIKEWWFEEMSTLFLTIGIIIMFLSGLSEKEAIGAFIAGAADLVGVALIIGLARAINIILDNGFITDTLLNSAINLVSGINEKLFAVGQLGVFSILGFFIPSSSGLAVLTMPIMAPLADSIGVSREIVVNAYNWGQGLVLFITPTGLILVILEMAEITFDKWLKYILPLVGIIGVYTIIMLLISVTI